MVNATRIRNVYDIPGCTHFVIASTVAERSRSTVIASVSEAILTPDFA